VLLANILIVKMLSTPLRRCAITQLVLPRAMMFRMTSQIDQKESTSAQQEGSLYTPDVSAAIEETASDKALARRRSRRYILKEARKDKGKALLRAQCLLLHKVVTSITPESKERFQKQLLQVKEQIIALDKRRPGRLMPFGLTRKSVSQSRGIAQGRSIWLTLDKKIVAEIPDRSLHKILPSTSSAPSDMRPLVQEGLEVRVVEEARQLLQRITTESRKGSDRYTWLIRRLVGKEMHSVLQDGCIELRDGKDIRLACLIVKEGEVPVFSQETDVYDLQSLISDEERRNAIKKSFQSIAIFLNRRVIREQRRSKSSQKANVEKATEDQTSIDERLQRQGKKQPRILAVKRDERTVDLCIALWRLDAWCRSG
jgi:hypothetical protein